VEADIPFSDSGVHDFALMDGRGAVVPIQFLKILRSGDRGIRQARIAFIARDIPPIGYAVYHAVPNATGSPTPADDYAYWAPDAMTHEFRGAIENEFYRLSFNMRTGEITSLLVKDGHWEALAGPGNVVAREDDGGDVWELNGPLSWGLAASTRPIGAPRPAQTQWSNAFEGPGERILGPVFSEFHVKHSLGKNEFATRVRIYQGSKRIDIRTDLVNQEKFVRYRAVFPSTIANGTLMEEIPFGAIQRPQNQEYAAQNWIDYADAHKGITLINHGLPGNNVADGKLMVSLMRSANIRDDSDVNLRSSDLGLGIGQSYTLDYALIPHEGEWRAATPWRTGMEFNNPLIVQSVASHGGDLPSQWGLLDVSADNVVVSAVKLGKDGVVILRVYEASGRPVSDVHVRLHAKLEQVHEVNLLEDLGAQIDSRRDGFTFGIKPFEIKTFRLQVTQLSTALQSTS
jgi:alpha-mannosidase